MTASTCTVSPDGTVMWTLPDGQLHREDGPAIVDAEGNREWWQHGMRHRDDGPANVFVDGTKMWRANGQMHRADGPAVIMADGTQKWAFDGELHRENGPAIITDRREEWWYNGQRHRVDGPARQGPHDQWHIEGHLVDVTRWDRSLLNEKEIVKPVRQLVGRHVDSLRNPHDVHSDDLYITLQYIKTNLSVDMLTHPLRSVAAVAAWHLPVDDDYFLAALKHPFVQKIVRHRTDVPEHVSALLEVVA